MHIGAALLTLLSLLRPQESPGALRLNELEYFENRGLDVLVFSNPYNDLFSDSKMGGIEIIHHGVRTATNGDVRLNPTPEQWDPLPQFQKRRIDRATGTIEAFLRYPAYDFAYSVTVRATVEGVVVAVHLERPLPDALRGKAGFNLEFLPPAYVTKGLLADGRGAFFPLSPAGPMCRTGDSIEPEPIASGRTLVLAPEDPAKRIAVQSKSGDLMLLDGRNKAQNGWFVVRELLPPGKSGRVLEWSLTASTIPGWVRIPMIAFSQVGYHPGQKKTAVIELDRNDRPLGTARLLQVTASGEEEEVFRSSVKVWGHYLRYQYATFDFTPVRRSGLYVIEYGAQRTGALRIAPDVYENTWQQTLDVFFPVQMDHVAVREAYRIWHGAPHLDDARQAPVNHEHFDLYAQGPTTDTPYSPGEHIPGLNVGGWFDAGDFDIRTQSQYLTILSMVQTWEEFQPAHDQTTVRQESRSVEIHRPDGKADLLQQIEHGVLQLIAQHRMAGHAIPGIIDADLSRYTHLGDAAAQTDNRIYDQALDSTQSNGVRSGRPDDRWAFTSRSSALNYGSAAALAAASRALRTLNDTLARVSLALAERVWEEEQGHRPDLFRHGNTTGGPLEDEMLRAAVELLICTREAKYGAAIRKLWPHIESNFNRVAGPVVRSLPQLSRDYTERTKTLAMQLKERADSLDKANPFGVPISPGGWGGNGLVVSFANTCYLLHKAFPEILGPEYTLRAIGYLFGCHPASSLSFVSGVGAAPKKVAYGNNRADYSYIAGGIVPGIVIVQPDFPENKDDWPYLWGENEYVIGIAAAYLYLAHAANDCAREPRVPGRQ